MDQELEPPPGEAFFRLYEELGANQWPSEHTLLLDGWVVRRARGYTKRANSVVPLGHGANLSLPEKTALVEGFYRGHGQKAIFKMTEASQPAGLDAFLKEKGYVVVDPSEVHVRENLPSEPPSEPGGATVAVRQSLNEEWKSDFLRLSGITGNDEAARRVIWSLIQLPAVSVAVLYGGQAVSTALAVIQDRYAGIVDVATAVEHRGKGFARLAVLGALSAAKNMGASQAYLQVMQNNDPARRLYGKLGFKKLYNYWYRVKG